MSFKKSGQYTSNFAELTAWTESTATGDEFYTDIAVPHEPIFVFENGVAMTEGVLGSLNAGEYAFGDNDALGTDRIYVKVTTPDSWASSTAYVLGDFIVSAGNHYSCTTAGTTGGSSPSFDTTIGNTTNDGTVVWTRRDNYNPEDYSSDKIKATLATTLIDVTAGHSVIIASIEMTNRNASTGNVRIIRTNDSDVVFFQETIGIPTTDSAVINHGICLEATDKIKVMVDKEEVAVVINYNNIDNT